MPNPDNKENDAVIELGNELKVQLKSHPGEPVLRPHAEVELGNRVVLKSSDELRGSSDVVQSSQSYELLPNSCAVPPSQPCESSANSCAMQASQWCESSLTSGELQPHQVADSLHLVQGSEELGSENRRKISHHFHEISKSSRKIADGRLDRKTKRHLAEILGDPHALEHEWQRACTLLGDHNLGRLPSNGVSYRARVRLAMTASWLVLLYLPYLYCVVPKSYDFLKDITRGQPVQAADPPNYDKIKCSIDRKLPTSMRGLSSRLYLRDSEVDFTGAVVLFTVERNVSNTSLFLVHSSGDEAVDWAAYNAVGRMLPFLTPPAGEESKAFYYTLK